MDHKLYANNRPLSPLSFNLNSSSHQQTNFSVNYLRQALCRSVCRATQTGSPISVSFTRLWLACFGRFVVKPPDISVCHIRGYRSPFLSNSQLERVRSPSKTTTARQSGDASMPAAVCPALGWHTPKSLRYLCCSSLTVLLSGMQKIGRSFCEKKSGWKNENKRTKA